MPCEREYKESTQRENRKKYREHRQKNIKYLDKERTHKRTEKENTERV